MRRKRKRKVTTTISRGFVVASRLALAQLSPLCVSFTWERLGRLGTVVAWTYVLLLHVVRV